MLMSNIGRPIEFDPEKALEAAMGLFWLYGYEATSLQNLISEMGISKSSFYQTFKSKQALFQSCLLHYKKTLLEQLNCQLNQATSGKNFINDVFESIASEVNNSKIPKGCFLMNTANEFSQTDPKIAKMVLSSIESLKKIFEQAVKQSQQRGEISNKTNPKSLATYLVSSISGLRNMIKAGANRQELKDIIKITLSIMD